MTEREAEIIGLVHKEVKPALGCTEPIAVALAVAKAVETIRNNCCGSCPKYDGDLWRLGTGFRIRVEVSGNILKNGMGVGIPGTGMVGLHIAAALGAVCGKSEYSLEVLHDLDPASIARAKELVADGAVDIVMADTDRKLYVKATVEAASHDGCCPGKDLPGNRHKADAVIMDDHDRIVETVLDSNVLFTRPQEDSATGHGERSTLDYHLTVKEIYDFVNNVSYDDISFILESRTLNMALAREGLEGSYGLMVGKTIGNPANREVFGNEFMSYAMSLTAAASDARMAGCTLAAMSNSGSGNQGITVTMPVIAYAKKYQVDDCRLARALMLSHLVAIHIKGYLGKLSALCGCVIASTGSSCGLVYLRGGSYEQVCSAIKNMIGNITGMVCDGAKVGCALKVASGVSCSVQSALLALSGTCISEHDGIIEKDIEKTIRNLGRIGSVGMQATDTMILDIMSCK
ncbi:MAG: L-serine ammonia-lyase, iron-sulfur-dependent, subunit alpha [Bacteroidales bacterium]|nr:L-serine ammonia-lyase, iron-sulfur-dependent, subunit alpha [Bacteroidales bacterium]